MKKCVNCGHASFLKSNFKCLPDGRAYCIKNEDCVIAYNVLMEDHNPNARLKGDKVK